MKTKELYNELDIVAIIRSQRLLLQNDSGKIPKRFINGN